MNTRLLLPLTALAGALLLTGCGQTGPLPTFGKAITPEWITADFDGQPGDEYIATSNLQDVVFNARGEVIGWYVKPTAGTPYIKKTNGAWDFSSVKGQAAMPNMVGVPVAKGTAPTFPADRRALALTGGALDPAQPAETSAPQLRTDLAANRQDAVFRYTQGGVSVTKTITLHPRNFKIDVKTDVSGGPAQVQMRFPGLGRADNPRVQAYAVGAASAIAVQGAGTQDVKNVQYAALQENPSQVAHAVIVRPQAGTTLDATLTGGPQGLISATLPASSSLEVYGGKNELIHLYQSGYTALPGVFKPNPFGQISLIIVKLMETLYKFIGNWGLVLVVLTILLRAIMWPLMQTQGRTTARMQVMQPKIKEIQEKYKERKDADSQRAMQAEMAQLYRDYNFNPAGCLSTFIPFPVLIALWSTIRNFEFDSGFLWLPDLAVPDPFYILAVIYLIVNVGQLYVMTRKNPDMFRQQAMIYIVFLYFALTFPAGVTIYIILSTLIGIGQQILINKQVERETATIGQKVEKAPSRQVARANAKTIDAPKK
ncbi:YidC/Oxa1 family membrane protein insertase [Deinococcus metalli]|uniref:Membrane protein insertase YidC n=1 Tax=Deinococcus metalli TaxID=1141878 RepID=A0A7W8KGW4_9DEIO|nr:membrane protein insertase YidC [Deinococcus metalli]MBB5376898.1 YidC/Oxa1 family membrane protein insertase [Deinococcus metalli]GHF46178.1 membrane protein insertase YidC [Deinococcus metalli]